MSGQVPFRPLFVNEGALGSGVVGHPRLEEALRDHLVDVADVEPRFVRLPPMGPAARIATRGVPGLATADADAQRLRWHLVQSARARRVVRDARREAPVDVVHVHSHTVALRLGDVMRAVPTFVSVDATIRDWEHLAVWRPVRPWTDALLAPSYALERAAFSAAAGVIAWTEWAAAGVRRANPEAAVHVIHPGVDVGRFRPARKEGDSPRRVLFVGGRFGEKGGDVLVDVLLPRLGRSVELDVVTTAAVDLPRGVRVHRLSPGSPDLVALYQRADVLCLPTRADAAPWVVLEAMACGVPVVATDVGAIGEMVGDGGAVVPVGDRRALDHALAALLEDPARRAALGAAGRRRCEERYDHDLQSARLLALLRDAH